MYFPKVDLIKALVRGPTPKPSHFSDLAKTKFCMGLVVLREHHAEVVSRSKRNAQHLDLATSASSQDEITTDILSPFQNGFLLD